MIDTSLFENGRYLALLVISIIVVGVTSYNSLGRQEDPSITPFVASVQTFYPGAGPARVESLVTKPLEDALREHPDVQYLGVFKPRIPKKRTFTRSRLTPGEIQKTRGCGGRSCARLSN